MPEAEEHEWFAREILVHEVRLRRQLRSYLPTRADVEDVLQEAYARFLALSRADRERMHAPAAFLFTIARNLSLDSLRRPRAVSIDELAELDARHVPDDRPTPCDEIGAKQEFDILQQAIASLPERCRDVIVMRKVQGKSQREIAAALSISESTVEKHVANGIRLCAKFMRDRAVRPESQSVPMRGVE